MHNPPPAEFVFPDYHGGSLLNLMQTLMTGLGLAGNGYAPLRPELGLTAADIAQAKQVVLIVIDGLGNELLERHAPNGQLAAHQVGKLTSVYPSTTASAIPTFFTALPPQAHALTGWHMWFEEIGQTLSVLPLNPREPGVESGDPEQLAAQLFAHQPISASLAGRCFTVAPQDIVESPFNRYHTQGAQRIGYWGIKGFIDAIAHAVSTSTPQSAPNFIYAYYPALDSLMHGVGTSDARVTQRLQQIDAAVATLQAKLAGTNTLLIVTADHGFIDAPKDHLIALDEHPELAAMLLRPLCGERRLAYAYVRPECHADFQDYVNEHLSDACRCIPTAEFIVEGWFGPGAPHPQLASRAGDFVLQMRGDWTIKDWLEGEKHYEQPGVHAGASAQEMWVPLIVSKP